MKPAAALEPLLRDHHVRSLHRLDGYVYAIARNRSGPIKFGHSADPMRRTSSLRMSSPVPLQVLALFASPDRRGLETRIHELLSSSREHGEWFRALPASLEIVDALAAERLRCCGAVAVFGHDELCRSNER